METRFTADQLADPATAASEAEIRKCVHCGFCNAVCPTYGILGDELDGPRGRIYLMKDMLENERSPSAEVVKHIDRCLSCLSCRTTCPSSVDYMRLVDHARAYIEARYRRPWPDRLYRSVLAAILPHRGRMRAALALARLTRPLQPLLPRTPLLAPIHAMLALVPPRGQPAPRAASSSTAPQPRRGRVALLRGCVEPVMNPQIQAAASRLLTRVGYEVVGAPDEACCGALVHHMGRETAAMDAARRNVDAWSALGELDAIVVTASGCGVSIKDYGHLLARDPAYAARAAAVSALAKDVTEFLDEAGLPPPAPDAPHLTVTYHAACSLQHGQSVRDAPRRLLLAAGYAVKEPADPHLCCGSAGTYNLLQPEIAGRLRDLKVSALEARQGDVIAAGNIGCLAQIGSATQTPVVHTVELLDWATGGPRPPGL